MYTYNVKDKPYKQNPCVLLAHGNKWLSSHRAFARVGKHEIDRKSNIKDVVTQPTVPFKKAESC